MSHVDEVITAQTHEDLKALAAKHYTFPEFMHDVEVLAERMWHNSRRQSEQDINVPHAHKQHSIVGDSEPRSTEATSPAAEDNAVQQTPAQPASPQSEGGFPTSNVGVQVPAEESQPAG